MDELQRVVEARDNAGVEAALLRVEKSRLRHNSARDRLAAHLTGTTAESVTLQTARDEKRVRETARLLWEFAGKPEGTEKADWLRAEKLVRSAVAGQ
ncbi:MAG: DUF2934 domain-containing protein [Acidobacteriota bacterium]|nr:DUF2934 domain-containing protein [Acidobacteriota bacterium]